METENKTLVIWFNDGTTGYFEHVENFMEEDIGVVGDDVASELNMRIVFDYFGKSTALKRSACFMLSNLAGYALSK